MWLFSSSSTGSISRQHKSLPRQGVSNWREMDRENLYLTAENNQYLIDMYAAVGIKRDLISVRIPSSLRKYTDRFSFYYRFYCAITLTLPIITINYYTVTIWIFYSDLSSDVANNNFMRFYNWIFELNSMYCSFL